MVNSGSALNSHLMYLLFLLLFLLHPSSVNPAPLPFCLQFSFPLYIIALPCLVSHQPPLWFVHHDHILIVRSSPACLLDKLIYCFIHKLQEKAWRWRSQMLFFIQRWSPTWGQAFLWSVCDKDKKQILFFSLCSGGQQQLMLWTENQTLFYSWNKTILILLELELFLFWNFTHIVFKLRT